MTREEEIRVRVEKYGACYSSLSLDHPQAGDDLRYLLARNEELQRRVEKMNRIVEAASRSSFEYFHPATGDGCLICHMHNLRDALNAADAEEK